MKKIIVTNPTNGEITVFKSRYSTLKDRVYILPHTFVIKGKITNFEWAKSHQLISERFNLSIKETNIDGRLKENKSLPFFTWKNVI